MKIAVMTDSTSYLSQDLIDKYNIQIAPLSVTFDDGKEFSEHKRITDAGIETYFADPYKSIQRARNENTNGLIRQYLPKSSSFDDVSNEQIKQIEFALNHRPRKTLGWYTPSEVMAGFYTVALAA